MPSAAERRLSRLLGDPPGAPAPQAERLVARVRADPAAVAEGLVTEALASDDVTSAAGALAFVAERLAELAALLPPDLRSVVGREAEAAVRRRVPG
jgi:hypothetical protein